MNGEVYEVGDELESYKYYDTHGIPTGVKIVVTSKRDTSRTTLYTGRITYHPYGPGRVDDIVADFGGSYFRKVGTHTPPPPPKSYSEMEKDEFARHVVAVGKLVMQESTRRFGFCSEGKKTLDEFFRRAGLGDFITVTKRVTVEVEVPATANEDAIRELAVSKMGDARVDTL